MRLIGFSSGALAKGDFRRGVELQRNHQGIAAIELSALRDYELDPFLEGASALDLEAFSYISFHAPSRLKEMSEETVVEKLRKIPTEWPIVVHPDLIQTPDLWRSFGPRLCLENMDNRKTTGRTVEEMQRAFALLPEAGFCFDIGHARQIDPTMTTAIRMLIAFADRLRQVHVSEVGPRGEHLPLSIIARQVFRRVVRLVPEDVPLIIESIVEPYAMDREIEAVREVFSVGGGQAN